jgi:hypothetical protein
VHDACAAVQFGLVCNGESGQEGAGSSENTSVQTLAEKTPHWATCDFHSNYDIERPVSLARQQWQHICSSSNRFFIRAFIGAFIRVCIRVFITVCIRAFIRVCIRVFIRLFFKQVFMVSISISYRPPLVVRCCIEEYRSEKKAFFISISISVPLPISIVSLVSLISSVRSLHQFRAGVLTDILIKSPIWYKIMEYSFVECSFGSRRSDPRDPSISGAMQVTSS